MKAHLRCPNCRSLDVLYSKKNLGYICEDCGKIFRVESGNSPRRIFISYGRDEYATLAQRLKTDLEKLGHGVWFDLDRLKSGRDWQEYIELGLKWASEDTEKGFILLVMTPHSVRRPDGYCLNEITRGMEIGLGIIPIMAVWCEPPLSISRIQWLDMQDCIPVTESSERYQSKFERLAEALEDGHMELEGGQSRLFRLLEPLPFDGEFGHYLNRFTGRKWITEIIDAWLRDRSAPKLFWITGKPGIGKTALASWLCHNRREVAAFHLCRHGHRQKADPRRCVLSIAYQLSTQLPDYARRVSALNLEENISQSDAKTLFDNLVIQPLSGNFPKPDRTILIIIDALDEATISGKNELAAFIASEYHKIPPWLRLIITSRPDPEMVHLLQGFRPFDMGHSQPENEADLRAYIGKEFAYFATDKQVPNDFIEKTVSQSEGVFLYAAWLRQEFEMGSVNFETFQKFPQGLGGIYAQFFERQFPDLNEYEKYIRPALEIVIAMREPLELKAIAKILSWNEHNQSKFRRSVGSLFPIIDGRIGPFHKSVSEWLTDQDKAGPYFLSLVEGHRILAENCLKMYQTNRSKVSRYVLLHLPAHLKESGRWEDLEDILTDLTFVESKCRSGMVFELAGDYESVVEAWNRKNRLATVNKVRMKTNVIATNGSVGDAFCREILDDNLHSGFSSLSMPEGIQNDNVCDDGELRRICLDSSDRLSQSRLLQKDFVNASRPAQNGIEDRWFVDGPWSPSEDLKEFSTFVFQHLHQLASNPELTLVIARNWAGSGVVSAQAEKLLKRYSLPWLSRDPRLPKPSNHPSCLKIFQEHTNVVTSIAVIWDTSLLLSGGRDRTIRIWDAETGRCMRSLTHHSHDVTCVAVSSSANLFASGSLDKTIGVWDLSNFNYVGTLKGHLDGVKSLEFIGKRKMLASAGRDNTILLWDLQSGTCLNELKGHAKSVEALSATPDGKLLVSGGHDRTIRVWDIDRGKCLLVITSNVGILSAMQISPDGKTILSAGRGNDIKTWDVASGKCKGFMVGHAGAVNAVSITPDSEHAISGGTDKTLRFWEISSQKCLKSFLGHTDEINALSVSPNWERAMSASSDRSIRLWDLTSNETQNLVGMHSNVVRDIEYNSDGRTAISASRDGLLGFWKIPSDSMSGHLKAHSGGARSVRICLDSKMAFSVGKDAFIRMWDLSSQQCLRTVKAHKGAIYTLALSPDGGTALTAGRDRLIRFWGTKDLRLLRTAEGHTNVIFEIVVSPDCSFVVSAGADKTARICDFHTCQTINLLEGHTNSVRSVKISKDGKILVTGSVDKSIIIWDVRSSSPRRVLRGHSHGVRCLALTPDSNFLISGSYDSTVRLWDLESGDLMSIYHAGARVMSLSEVRPDGKFACGTEDGHIHFLSFVNLRLREPTVTAVHAFKASGDCPEISSVASTISDIRKANLSSESFLEQNPSSGCPWCGQRFLVGREKIQAILAVSKNLGLHPKCSPCLEFPHETWEAPQLLMQCPSCAQPMRFNPFLVDNRHQDPCSKF